MESLQRASHKLAEEIYKSTAGQKQTQTAGAGAGTGADAETSGHTERASEDDGQYQKGSSADKKDDVIDADFKAENEK